SAASHWMSLLACGTLRPTPQLQSAPGDVMNAALLPPVLASLAFALGARIESQERPPIVVREPAAFVEVETHCLHVPIRPKGYVRGVAAGGLLDRKTGARDLGFGLHIMDFLLAPGWRDDGYPRDAKLHGNLPKHYVEGPQICTQAKELKPEILRAKGFVAV